MAEQELQDQQISLFDAPRFQDATQPEHGLLYAIYRARVYQRLVKQYGDQDKNNLLGSLIDMLKSDVRRRFPLFYPTDLMDLGEDVND